MSTLSETSLPLRKTLIKGATIVSMDDEIGVLPAADLLIEGGIIKEIGYDLLVQDPETVESIDAAGRIIVPGFVNSHMHTWQTALRGIASNWTLLEYFRWTHAGLATHYAPEDIYWGTLAGALNQINCGTTTLADWCHNNPTPEHTDAAVSGLHDSGIRAMYFHGSPKPDPKPGQAPFWEVPHDRAEIERLLSDSRFAPEGKLRLGMAILGPHYSTLDVAFTDFRLAQELSLVTSMHQGGGAARSPQGWAALEEAGLLGPHINIVHGNDLDEDQLRRFIDTGVTFSITPENEMTQGHGHPIIGRLRDHGVSPSIGIDLESGLSGEMFLAARIALVHQRALDNFEYRRQAHEEAIPQTSTITTLDALRWATVEGARMLGLLDRIGTITPGKQADLVVIDATQPNMQPVHDPVNSVLMQTSLANIESVMIGGRWRKRHGKLLNEAGAEINPQSWLEPLRTSGERLAAAVGLKSEGASLQPQ
jgi:cytosine/adenosine deaminase-related metal-dependent hydrolase